MQKTNNAAAAGIAGAVLGAGATAAAMVLSDKKKREKIAVKISALKKQGEKVADHLTKRADQLAGEAKKISSEERNFAREVKDQTEKEISS